jgi:hypothetical protein
MGQTGTGAGSILALWRYPVKSMLSEELDSSEVGERGVLGDRALPPEPRGGHRP